MFGKLRWRIAIPYVLLILATIVGLSAYLYGYLRDTHLNDLENQLYAEASLLADALAPSLAQPPGEPTDALARRYAELLGARITLIARDGVVKGESHEDRGLMDSHLDRPEVQAALRQGRGRAIRYSATLRTEMMYVAVPAIIDSQVVGFVRVALPLRQIQANLARLRGVAALTAAIAAFGATLLALFIAERALRPVRELTRMATRMAEGDLGPRLQPATQDEIGLLTQAFNEMARQLNSRMATLAQEKNRLAAMLAHMTDGVLITDDEGKILLINPAAARLLSTTQEDALTRFLAPVLRHHQLIEAWQRAHDSGQEHAEAVEIGTQLFLRIVVTPIEQAGAFGLLVLLQDLSQIRRLETIRRDFVSNISHELRTPLASLKALVDTLRDGALEDPPAAQRFLTLIETEVDAMTQMVEELLELSRIESGKVPLRLQLVRVPDLLIPAVDRLRPQAERAGLQMQIDLPPDLPQVFADAERIQQVVTNLVHNAIKFTPKGKITVAAWREQGNVVVSVKDTGVGISAEDLPRVFERFYKADRARSGGGTGLGLAISKHIVQAHNGRIWAESVEGAGSTFFFSLPAAASQSESGGTITSC